MYKEKEVVCLEINRVGSRGVLFTWYELGGLETNMYVVDGVNHIFVADTFLGPGAMDIVKQYIHDNFKPKPIVVFNSHFHWDHIWGNCAFKGSTIISHQMCRDLILKVGQEEMDKFKKYMMGSAELVCPNLTFDGRIVFHEDGVEFFHSPGHTEDSSSMMDTVDNVVFAGDNIESPIPFLSSENLDAFVNTLNGYLSMKNVRVIAGHRRSVDTELIEFNKKYIEKFISGDTGDYSEGDCGEINEINLKTLRGKQNNL
jgi:Zn-dependent hydrolases, including glyoxylases